MPWVRIHKVPDYVHFPHVRHVNAGVTCQTCHGQVQKHGSGLPGRVAEHGLVRQLPRERLRPEGRPEGRGLRHRAAARTTPGGAVRHAGCVPASPPDASDAARTGRRATLRRRRRYSVRQSVAARDTTAPPVTTSPPEDSAHEQRTGSDGRQAPRLPQGRSAPPAPRRTRRAARSEKVGKLIPYLVHPDQTVPGVSTYYATTCRECAAGLRHHRRDARRPHHQARGQPGAPAQPRRALRARPVGAPGAVQSRPLPRRRW